jgi:hypothetical protein
MTTKKTEEEKEAIRIATWWGDQPMQEFEVISGDGERLLVNSHEVSAGSPQPVLTFSRYELRERDEIVVTGTKREPVETLEPVITPLILPVAFFNAGAWISVRDTAYTSIVSAETVENE